MKKLIIISICCILYVFSTSCKKVENFLDKAPGVDVTIDTVFSSQTQMETFLGGVYNYGIHSGYPYMSWVVNNVTYSNSIGWSYYESAGDCDEAEWCNGYNGEGRYDKGFLDPSVSISMLDVRFVVRWAAVRMANILMTNVDRVPEISKAYADQVKGEARFIRALNYSEMMKRYGGVPILKKALDVNGDLKIPRSSLKSVVKFILDDCEYAISVLPDVYPATQTGRITKGAALALKAKVLLYVASPLYNSATPYLEMANQANDSLICMGDNDQGRWQVAADAAKAILDWAPSGSVQLVTNQGVANNYKYVWSVPDNDEIILAEKQKNGGTTPFQPMLATCFSPGWGTGLNQTFNFCTQFYDNTDGTPVTWSTSGNDLKQKYLNIDNRFKADILYQGSYFNSTYPSIDFVVPGLQSGLSKTGTFVRKWVPDNYANGPVVNSIVFRLAEAYLMYAEALNEAQGPVQAAYDAVNAIRARSGMALLPAGLTKDQFRLAVRKEWAVEFFCEDHRMWDIRRWMIIEDPGVCSGDFYKLTITKNPLPSTDFSYQRGVFETRVVKRSMYFWPFDQNEIRKGYLVQNPGY